MRFSLKWFYLFTINLQQTFCWISEWEEFNLGAPAESGFISSKSLSRISGRALSDLKKCSKNCDKRVRLVCDKEACEKDPYCVAMKCCGCYTRLPSCPRCGKCIEEEVTETTEATEEPTCPPCQYKECNCPTQKPCPICKKAPPCPECPKVYASKCGGNAEPRQVSIDLPEHLLWLETYKPLPSHRYRSMSIKKSDKINVNVDGRGLQCFPCPTCAPCPAPKPCAACPPAPKCPSLDDCPDQMDLCDSLHYKDCKEVNCVSPYCKCTYCSLCAEKVTCKCRFGTPMRSRKEWPIADLYLSVEKDEE